MDLYAEIEALRKADLDIEAGRKRVERQRAMVRRLESMGREIDTAADLLRSLQEALAAMEGHRVLIVERIEHLKNGA